MKTRTLVFFFIYVSALCIFTAHLLIVKKTVYGDGRYYFVYLPSILLEHTLNFSHAFHLIGADFFLTPLKYPANIYPIGPAVFWVIPYLTANILLLPFSRADGYNVFYQLLIGVWDVSFTCIGLYFLYRSLSKFFSESDALKTVLAVFFGTNLLFYGAVDTVNSHSISFFLSSLFVYLFLQPEKIKQAVLLGMTLGLSILVRSQDGLLILFPFTSLFIKQKQFLLNSIIILLTACIVFSPQMLLWHIQWGNWFQNPYLRVQTFYFFSPHILGVLFNRTDGLFLWTPLYLISFIGLLFYTYKNRVLGIPLVLFFILQVYVVSSWSIWWQGSSYSGRMLISSLPMLSFGLAHLMSSPFFQKITVKLVFALCFLNPLLIIFFLRFVK